MDPGKMLQRSSRNAAATAAAQAEFNEKRRVWIPDDTEGFLAGWIKTPSPPNSSDGDPNVQVEVVVSSTNETRTVPFYSLTPMNPPQFDGVEDIADLTHLNEASVINNLKQRYGSGSIYTYSGLFLISLNPYRDLPIYTPRIISQYRTRRREENAPHIFAVAERAWQQIGEERESQSILITGESGAGKTENTKKVIQYLAAIASSTVPPSSSSGHFAPSADPTPSSSSHSLSTAPASGLPRSGSFKGKMAEEISLHAISTGLGLLERQILQANPILEAFGNAQTMRNNNSSRFGKFIRIFFNPSGAIAGANIDWYLLEKSRVTRRSRGERGFHVFYQLLKGAKEAGLADKLLLTNKPQDYSFLNGSQLEIDGVDDLAEWRVLHNALDIVGFSKQEQLELFRVPAAILHIGNLLLSGSSSDQALFHPETQSTADKVCHLLGIPVKEFTRAVLQPKVRAGREWVTQSRTKKQAQDELGALCKFMYEKTFGWMVERINTALDRPSAKSLSIGVLDIAGFEIFETNSYEQLLINFTNEKLQQFFNFHMFTLEQEEYTREGIEWDYVNFGLDLQPTIELIESTAPVGILSVLDEECIMPKATDKTFTEKVQQIWEPPKGSSSTRSGGVHPGSAKIKHTRFSQGFVVKHYAGDVEYSTEGWLEKNKDPINDAVAKLLSASEVPSIASLFAEYAEEAAAGVVKKVRRGAFRTVGQRHKEQLNQLMTQLGSTQPHFVRCIVPNGDKKPGKVTVNLVLDQLRCNGVLEGIRIARLGYPNRHSFAEFRTRYEVLTPGVIPKGYMDGRKAAERIAEALDIERDFYKIGATKIFFKAGVLADLEERRDSLLMDVFSRFQAAARGYMAKRKASKLINRAQAVRTIQRNARVYIKLRDWPWWSLYVKVRPLLAGTREDHAMSKRAAELALAKEKERRDEEEKKRLEAIKAQLESQRAKVETELESERQLGADKDRMLERSKAREAELGDMIIKLENQLGRVEGDMTKLSSEREDAQSAVGKMQGEMEKLQGQLQMLEKDHDKARKREQELLKEGNEKRGLADQADKARLKLEEEVRRLKGELNTKEEGMRRLKERGELALKELEGRLTLEKGKAASGSEQITGLHDDLRKAKAAVDNAQAEVKRQETAVAAKVAELRDLQGKMADSASALQAAEKDKAALGVKIDTLSSQLAAREKERSADAAARQRLESELDDLRKVMAAKSSEDIKRQEADRSREAEMSRLREQVAAAQKGLDDQISQSQKLSEKLRVDFEGIASAYKAAQGEVTSLKSAIASKEKEADAARLDKERYAREARESRDELGRVQDRIKSLDGELSAMGVVRDQLQRQLAQRQTDFEALEDAVLEIETEKADWAKRMESTTRQLIDESAKRQHFEQQLHKAQVELAEYREAASEIEREMLQVTTDMKTRDREIALLKSRENKTIVEHVHVLESAKKYAEKQLHEQVSENRRLNGVLKNLEAQRNRLQGDMEDMQRQIELAKVTKSKEARQARVSMSADEKSGRAAYEDERRARVAAEAKVASLEIDLADFRRQLATRSISSSGGPRAASEARFMRQEEEMAALRAEYDAARAHNVRLQQDMMDMQRGLKTAQRQVSAAHRDMKEREQGYKLHGAAGLGHGHAPGTPSRADLLRGLERSHEVLGRDMSEQLRKLDNAPTTPRKYGHAASGSLSNGHAGMGTPNGADAMRARELEKEVEMLREQLARVRT